MSRKIVEQITCDYCSEELKANGFCAYEHLSFKGDLVISLAHHPEVGEVILQMESDYCSPTHARRKMEALLRDAYDTLRERRLELEALRATPTTEDPQNPSDIFAQEDIDHLLSGEGTPNEEAS